MVATFLKVSQLLPKATAAHSEFVGNTLCLCLPIGPAQVVPERGTKSSAIDFAVKIKEWLLEHPPGVIARLQAAARTWTQT